MRERVHRRVISELGPVFYTNAVEQRELRSRVERIVQAALRNEKTPMSAAELQQVAQSVADDVLGYGPIERLLHDPTVSEIMVNGPDQVYIERNGKIIPTRISFLDEAHLRHVTGRIVAEVGRHIDESSPMVDAAPSRRFARQCHLPAAGGGWAFPDHPEVCHRPLYARRPGWLRHVDAPRGGIVEGLCRRQGEHTGLRRREHRQNHLAQRAVVFYPLGRTHNHHRGCKGAPAPPAPRGLP